MNFVVTVDVPAHVWAVFCIASLIHFGLMVWIGLSVRAWLGRWDEMPLDDRDGHGEPEINEEPFLPPMVPDSEAPIAQPADDPDYWWNDGQQPIPEE